MNDGTDSIRVGSGAGATLAAGGSAVAAEPAKSSFGGGFGGTTLTLGGQGTAASAATATDDTELTHGYRGGYRGYYGGYRGFYGGYRGYYGGYRGYYGRGWGYGRYGGWGGYSPYYYSYGYRPFFRPWRSYYGYGGLGYGYGGLGYGGYGFGPGIYIGIAGTNDDKNAPVLTLGLPRAEAGSSSATENLPISLKKETPASPYRYKAYGEK